MFSSDIVATPKEATTVAKLVKMGRRGKDKASTDDGNDNGNKEVSMSVEETNKYAQSFFDCASRHLNEKVIQFYV